MHMPSHASIQRDLARRRRRARFVTDTRAATTGSALAIVLGLVGMVLVAAGGFTNLLPLIIMGAGATVLGFAVFLVAEKVQRDRSKRSGAQRRQQMARDRVQDAPASSESRPALPPRSPLADAAVAALTQETPQGGIYPPLPSARGAAATTPSAAMDAAPTPHAATTRQAGHAQHWTPGGTIRTPGMVADGDAAAQGEEEITFEAVDTLVATHGVTVGVAEARDHRAWPGSKEAPSWANFLGESRPTTGYDQELAARRMRERRQQLASQLPLVGGMLDPEARAAADRRDPMADKTRGKCSRCSAIIWAPKQRPIVLKCPGCGHKAKLF